MNIQIDEGKLNETELKEIRTHANACHKCDHAGHFQGDCLYVHDDDDTSAPVTGPMHHTLSANYPITETVLKLFLKETINAKSCQQNSIEATPEQ